MDVRADLALQALSQATDALLVSFFAVACSAARRVPGFRNQIYRVHLGLEDSMLCLRKERTFESASHLVKHLRDYMVLLGDIRGRTGNWTEWMGHSSVLTRHLNAKVVSNEETVQGPTWVSIVELVERAVLSVGLPLLPQHRII